MKNLNCYLIFRKKYGIKLEEVKNKNREHILHNSIMAYSKSEALKNLKKNNFEIA